MKKLAAAVIAFAAVLAVALPAAAAAPAVRLTVTPRAVYSGEPFLATARASTDCDWILAWRRERHRGEGRATTAAFLAPTVTKPTRVPVTARCFHLPDQPSTAPRTGATGPAERLHVQVPPSQVVAVVVTVLPTGGAASPPGQPTVPPKGPLPDTGGPDALLVLVALALLLGGSIVVRVGRRRA